MSRTCPTFAVGVLAVALPALGCRGESAAAPPALVDGTTARPPPVELEGVRGPGVMTALRVHTTVQIPAGTAAAACIADLEAAAGGEVVERIGVSGATVTFLGPGGRTVHGCDAAHPGDGGRATWCGRAYGRADAGRLRDPRLGLGCATRTGAPLGFAWLEPAAEADFVVEEHAGYAEVFPVVRGMPVRVTTDQVDIATSTATFSVSEHRRDGSRLRSYTKEIGVAG